MVLSVERAGIRMGGSPHHCDVRAEVDVGFETSVEPGHALVVDEFAEQLPLVGVLDEYRAVLVTAHRDESVREGCRLVEWVFFLLEGDGGLARRAAELDLTRIVVEAYVFFVEEDLTVAAPNAKIIIFPPTAPQERFAAQCSSL